MADFVVDNAHVNGLLRIIQEDMNSSDWELIMNDLLKSGFRQDILGENNFKIRVLRTLETWVSCTEANLRRYSNLISIIRDNGRVALAETLEAKRSELAALR